MVAAKKNPDSPAVATPPADVNALIAEQVKKQFADETARAPVIRDVSSGAKIIDLASYSPTKAKKVGTAVESFDSFPAKGLKLPPHVMQAQYDLLDTHKGVGMRAAQYVKCFALARLNQESGLGGDVREVAKSLMEQGKLDPFVHKALVEGTIIDGGIFVPPEFSNEIIPLLRNDAILLAMGIRSVPMSGDQLVYGRQNAAATGYYVGETFVTTYSQAKTGQLVLKTKKVKGLTAISDELLRDGGAAADEFIRDDLVRVLALRMDLAGLTGDGTQETPVGVRNWVASANVNAATQVGAAATFAEIAGDAGKAKQLMLQANIPRQGWAWAMSPRSRTYLETVSSTYGVFPFRDELLQKGTFQGFPVFDTAAIVNTGGGGSNESTVFLIAAPQYLFGVREGLIVQAFPGGTFTGPGGALVSGIDTGQTPITAEMRHDFEPRYTQGAAVISTVKWGA